MKLSMESFHLLPIILFAIIPTHSTICGYKILLYNPSISASHFITTGRVADALAKDGHNVTLFEVEFLLPLGKFNVSKLANTWRIHGPFVTRKTTQQWKWWDPFADNFFQTIWQFIHMFRTFTAAMDEGCQTFLTTHPDVPQQIRDEKFDVIMTEQLNYCGTGLANLAGIPVHILLISNSLPEYVTSLLGLPSPSSWVPSILPSDSSDRMSILQRFANLLLQTITYGLSYDIYDSTTAIFRRHFGQHFPSIRDIVNESPMVFVNADEFVDFPRPLFSNIVYIGGLGMGFDERNPTLPEPLQTEMAKGTAGVVFFSIGTVMSSVDLPENFRKNLFRAFHHFKDFHFIVRVAREDDFSRKFTEGMANVFLTDWVPQTSVLRHPRLRLFISHAGYNSVLEAAYAGVPFIGMPFFGDQPRNARVPERNGWGLVFDKRLLLEGSGALVDSLQRVLGNNSYAEGAKRVQRLLKTKPFTAEERLQKSMRFLEQNGGRMPELMAESRNMDAIRLYNLDLAILAAIFSAAIGVVVHWVATRAGRILSCRIRREEPNERGGERKKKQN